ncbi:lipopolysaccharide biosynthesis protein [Paremcibacter congregatus]|uniref:Polysaccharide biosynthesis protein n=1 Tax=Paremcibacter congregatus TaxID=2043170 RepID=A0A2G4YR92_9PROT|nr:oligosaccharide flippase family protein [Paremcibacter congregatus]PHZ84841.1 hypothetical protein CRD36_08925 [Paremcibacter congregatus]QDE26186.1 hypothetical protein FIV45_02220 [Paremcibacter congregatus]
MKSPNVARMKNITRSVSDKGFFHLLSSNFAVQFLGFGVILFLPSVLSPSEIGNARLLQSYSVLFILIGTFGYNVALLKVCAENITREEKAEVFKYCLYRTFFFSIISYVSLLVVNFFYIRGVNEVLGQWMPIYGVVIPFAAIVYCLTAYLQSQKRIKDVAKAQVIVRLTFLFLIILATYFFGFIGFVLSTIISYFVGIFPFALFIPLAIFEGVGETNRKDQINHYAYFTFFGVVVTTIGQYADLYLLDFLKVPDDRLGVYSYSILFLQAGMVVVNTVQSIVSPYISERQDNKEWVWVKTCYYQLLSFIFSIFIATGLYGGAILLTRYYLGEEYAELPDFVLGISGRFLIWSCFAVVGASLVGLGRFKEGFYLALITTPTGIILGYLFFPIWDIYGIIIAQMIAATLTLLGCWAVFWRATRRS